MSLHFLPSIDIRPVWCENQESPHTRLPSFSVDFVFLYYYCWSSSPQWAVLIRQFLARAGVQRRSLSQISSHRRVVVCLASSPVRFTMLTTYSYRWKVLLYHLGGHLLLAMSTNWMAVRWKHQHPHRIRKLGQCSGDDMFSILVDMLRISAGWENP